MHTKICIIWVLSPNEKVYWKYTIFWWFFLHFGDEHVRGKNKAPIFQLRGVGTSSEWEHRMRPFGRSRVHPLCGLVGDGNWKVCCDQNSQGLRYLEHMKISIYRAFTGRKTLWKEPYMHYPTQSSQTLEVYATVIPRLRWRKEDQGPFDAQSQDLNPAVIWR